MQFYLMGRWSTDTLPDVQYESCKLCDTKRGKQWVWVQEVSKPISFPIAPTRFGLISAFFLIIVLFVYGCDPRYGFIESRFQLAPESRLPRWIKIPSNIDRNTITVEITLYTFDRAKIVVRGLPPETQVLQEVTGKYRWHTFTEKQFIEKGSYAIYPNYSIINVDGVDEIFEQKRLEPLLYVADSNTKLQINRHKLD